MLSMSTEHSRCNAQATSHKSPPRADKMSTVRLFPSARAWREDLRSRKISWAKQRSHQTWRPNSLSCAPCRHLLPTSSAELRVHPMVPCPCHSEPRSVGRARGSIHGPTIMPPVHHCCCQRSMTADSVYEKNGLQKSVKVGYPF